jgi:hypothetical protein
VDISPAVESRNDLFLNILTAADSTTANVLRGSYSLEDGTVTVYLGDWEIVFTAGKVGGTIRQAGKSAKGFTDSMELSYR